MRNGVNPSVMRVFAVRLRCVEKAGLRVMPRLHLAVVNTAPSTFLPRVHDPLATPYCHPFVTSCPFAQAPRGVGTARTFVRDAVRPLLMESPASTPPLLHP